MLAAVGLTPDQERALELLREGRSTAEVAELLGIPRPTVWQWQNELRDFVELERAMSETKTPTRAPLRREDMIRIALPFIVVVSAAFFFYLGYC